MITTAAIFCLAQAMYFEARGEDLAHQLMVANTIINRVESNRFPNTVCEVVNQKHQFSYLWDSNPTTITDSEAWQQSVTWAMDYLGNPLRYHNGCHYAHKDLSPSWAKGMKSFVAGNHTFYEGGC